METSGQRDNSAALSSDKYIPVPIKCVVLSRRHNMSRRFREEPLPGIDPWLSSTPNLSNAPSTVNAAHRHGPTSKAAHSKHKGRI
jgi:hypothetical protein